VSPASGWFNNGASINLQAFVASGFQFTAWSCSGTGCYAGNAQSQTIIIAAPILELANFQQTPSGYSATFQENGLPGGVVWSILVGGAYYITSSPSITVTGLTGTVNYAYQGVVFGNYFYDQYYYMNCYLYQNYCYNNYWWYNQYFNYNQYYNNPYYLNEYICISSCVGSVSGPTTTNSGYAFYQTIIQPQPGGTYSATFQENGLPPSSSWSITVGGSYFSSSSSSITVYGLTGNTAYYYQSSVYNYACQSSCSGTIYGPSTVTASYYAGSYYVTTTYTTTVSEFPAGSFLIVIILAFIGLISLRRKSRLHD